MAANTRDAVSAGHTELRPCPFCGGEASGKGHIRYSRPLIDTHWADGTEINEAFFVNCIRCGIANGRSGLVNGYQTRAEAITAWNTRAIEAAEADLLGKALEALRTIVTYAPDIGVDQFLDGLSDARRILSQAREVK